MFSSLNSDFKSSRASRPAQRSRGTLPSSGAERTTTSLDGNFAEEEIKGFLPSNTLKGMKVLWRQARITSNLRRTNRDGQMPVEQLSDTSDSSDDSTPNILGMVQRPRRPRKVQKKDAGLTLATEDAVRETVAPREAKKAADKVKQVVDVAVQAMRPVRVDALVEGRLNMLESRLRLEEMRSKSWCVRMTAAEDNVKQLQAQVKALSAEVNGASSQKKIPQSSSLERGLMWANTAFEPEKTPRICAKNSQHLGKDFTAEFNAILQQIRRDNESEEMVGDS